VKAPECDRRQRPGGCGEGTKMRPEAKAFAIWAKASIRVTKAKALGRRPRNLEDLPLGGSAGPWANDGPSTVAQQAKAVEEEDTQIAPGGFYQA
jgi:hypothetical protein